MPEKDYIKIAMVGQPAFEKISEVREPDVALVYIFALAQGGSCGCGQAAKLLAFDAKRMEKAVSLLRLYSLAEMPGPAPKKEKEIYTPQHLAAVRKEDQSFGGLCSYMEAAMGRILRKGELETLYAVYDLLNLPADVLVLVINLCKMDGRLSAREFEKMAYRWHDQGIDTYARAENFLKEQKLRKSRAWTIQRIFGIQDRKLSDTEEKYVNSWIEKEISDELIRAAYDKTVLRTAKLSWEYLNTILTRWLEQGLKTIKQVDQFDKGTGLLPGQSAQGKTETVEATVRHAFERRRQLREQTHQRRLEELGRLDKGFLENEKEIRITASKMARAPEGQREQLEAAREKLIQKRRECLALLGKPGDYLDNLPQCPLCGDMGYIGAQMCQCFRLACREEEQRRGGDVPQG